MSGIASLFDRDLEASAEDSRASTSMLDGSKSVAFAGGTVEL